MDSFTYRINSLVGTYTMFLIFIALGNSISSYWHPSTSKSPPRARVDEITDMMVHRYLQAEQSNLRVSLEADLSEIFNWNTRQLFVYAVATYSTPKNRESRVVIWDNIVQNPTSAAFKFDNIKAKYPLRDQYRLLRNRNVTIDLRYQYMPDVGPLKMYSLEGAHFSFFLPNELFGQDQRRPAVSSSPYDPSTEEDEVPSPVEYDDKDDSVEQNDGEEEEEEDSAALADALKKEIEEQYGTTVDEAEIAHLLDPSILESLGLTADTELNAKDIIFRLHQLYGDDGQEDSFFDGHEDSFFGGGDGQEDSFYDEIDFEGVDLMGSNEDESEETNVIEE